MNAFFHVKMISVSFIWHIRKVRPEANTFGDHLIGGTQDPKGGTQDLRPGPHLIGGI